MLRYYIKNSGIQGKGVFARTNLKSGESIGIVKGPIVPDNEESCRKYGAHYIHSISYTHAILVKNSLRFTNHSCEPSCGLKNRIEIVAMKDIKKNNEITIDYDTLDYNWEMICNCGSQNCRKKIRGYKYLDEKLKDKYKEFTAPYLLFSAV